LDRVQLLAAVRQPHEQATAHDAKTALGVELEGGTDEHDPGQQGDEEPPARPGQVRAVIAVPSPNASPDRPPRATTMSKVSPRVVSAMASYVP
jgi:hypothetical protein